MKLSQFKYTLPPELIASFPAENRDDARLMVIDRQTGTIEHKLFRDLIDYFEEQDVIVRNDTLVFPAALVGQKEKISELLLAKSVPTVPFVFSSHFLIIFCPCFRDRVCIFCFSRANFARIF